MTREHIVRLTILTACIFGFSIYMQKGTWIFPFPLYELAMLAAIIALFIVERQRPSVTGLLALTWALLQLSASEFILEFFVSGEQAQWLFESLITDYLLLGFSFAFLVWGMLICWKLPNVLQAIGGTLCCLVFTGCFVFNEYLWAMFPLVTWLLILFLSKREATIHRNILFLFTFFFLSKHLTLFFLAG